MNDALKQTAEADALAAQPATAPFLVADETESAAKGLEHLPKPAPSFLETVYYWVITRS